jgi:hypothetical protein
MHVLVNDVVLVTGVHGLHVQPVLSLCRHLLR